MSLLEPKGIPTVFGHILEKNVTFCIDTSGSMYKGLDMIKEHLIETLVKMANSGKPYMFNIIEFNSEVTQWSDKLVTCTPQTVAVAKQWVDKLVAKTGTNTKSALVTALNDYLCQAVYLVTDGLPDHHPVEILDQVGSVGKMRPIHCIYLSTEDSTESAAIEFLEDLAVESYGSFHIVTLTTHGCVDRITPIYRSEHAQERIIRTVNGTLRSQVPRTSVTTTLACDPEESVMLAPRTSLLGPRFYPPWGPYWPDLLGQPYRYYYPHAWSRYRPARGWIKSQEQMLEAIETQGLSPAAGSLLINKTVLARRIDDGYFYSGVVKSQVLSEKFLVAFGPCKHGKYSETTYQDTHVFDIIDYDDAKRHTILTGDQVLAPWEPEGERYGPGTVIEGHEKRQADGPDDKEITVSFTNGKVTKVAGNLAVWLPKKVFERLALELKMPREAREELAGEEGYPRESLEGYPTSGVVASPEEFDVADPLYFDYDPLVVENRPWRYPFHPPYPIVLKRSDGTPATTTATVSAKAVVRSEDMEALVPGTNLTQKQLDERITSQLMEHKLLLDEKETEKGTNKDKKEQTGDQPTETELERELRERLEARRREWEMEWEKQQELIAAEERERLLKRRQTQEDNTLRKSVSFKEEQSGEEEACSKDLGDSGRGTSLRSMAYCDEEPDTYFSDPEESRARDCGVNTDSSLLYKPRSKLVSRRPPWKKYWRADPGMPVTNSHHGPFRETALAAPLEARNQYSPYICEWTSPVYKFVDPFARYNKSGTVESCLKPHPPSAPAERTNYRPTPPRPMSADTKEALRKEFKQRKYLQREQAWNLKMKNYENMKEAMQDQHRERIQAQIDREKNRQGQEQRQIEESREQKKYISREVRQRIEANQQREMDREERRLKAMQQRREQREAMQQQKEKHFEEAMKMRAEVKAHRSQERWDKVTERLDKEEKEADRLRSQHQMAKQNRLSHFQQLEAEGQQRKDMRIGVSNHHLSMFHSTALC